MMSSMGNPRLHRLAEERSLAIHRHIASLLDESAPALEAAKKRVRSWLEGDRVARPYAEAWLGLLERPIAELKSALTDPSEAGRALRQASPFAGSVDPQTRWRIWRETRESRNL
jgi:hypothetical protein